MDTSKKNFDVILSLIKNFDVLIDGFPKVDSAFARISIPFTYDVDDTLVRTIDEMLRSTVPLGFAFYIDETMSGILEQFSDLPFPLAENFQIIATLTSQEALSLSMGVLPPSIFAQFYEQLLANFISKIGTISIWAEATAGFWRVLSTWDYDDSTVPIPFPISYWNTKLLSDLDFKESEEYL
jgi:hypothetical protein